jgi:ubiquitin-protein ligase
MSQNTKMSVLTTKRLTGEIRNLEKDRETYYQVVQDKTDPFLFFFLLRGATDSVYRGGYYIGKICLPKDYPTSPGDFYMLTPSGRFQVNTKICLTNSGYHKESWTPMWNIKNMVIGFVSVFLSDNTTGISHIQETVAERQAKAADSMTYNLAKHKDICEKFDQFVKPDGTVRTDMEVEQYVKELRKGKKKKKNTDTEPEPELAQDKNIVTVTKTPDLKPKHGEEKKVEEKKNSVNENNMIGENDDNENDNNENNSMNKTISTAPNTKQNIVIPDTKQDIADYDDDNVPSITVKNLKTTKKSPNTINPIKKVVPDSGKKITSLGKKGVQKPFDQEPVDKRKKMPNQSSSVKESTKKSNAKEILMTNNNVGVKVVRNANSGPNNKSNDKSKKSPMSYEQWRRLIEKSTIRTHDAKLFSMTFY